MRRTLILLVVLAACALLLDGAAVAVLIAEPPGGAELPWALEVECDTVSGICVRHPVFSGWTTGPGTFGVGLEFECPEVGEASLRVEYGVRAGAPLTMREEIPLSTVGCP